MKKRNVFFLYLLLFAMPLGIFGQNTVSAQIPPTPSPYPIIVSSMSLFLPIVSTNIKTTTWNFSNTFSIGLACGVNILYSDKFGFSFDLSPVISTTNGISKVSNVIFDPGPIFRLKKGYAIITRIAFETAGRFGESTVFTKVFSPAKKTSLSAALGIPLRFGNNLSPSIGATLFFGIAFR